MYTHTKDTHSYKITFIDLPIGSIYNCRRRYITKVEDKNKEIPITYRTLFM